MIIVSSKNRTISIIVKQDITVNRQNRLIAHPYFENTLWRKLYCTWQMFREGKLSQLITKHYLLENFCVNQVEAIIYYTQQVIQGGKLLQLAGKSQKFSSLKHLPCTVLYSSAT